MDFIPVQQLWKGHDFFFNMLVSSEAQLSHLCNSKTKFLLIIPSLKKKNSHSVLSLCQPNLFSYNALLCLHFLTQQNHPLTRSAPEETVEKEGLLRTLPKHRVDILTLCFSTNTIYDNTNEKQNSRHIVYPQSHKHKSSSRQHQQQKNKD